MLRQAVQSESLKSVGYDLQTHTLEVEFHGSKINLWHRHLLAQSLF